MIDELLKQYGLTRYQVTKLANISKTTLFNANNNKDVSSWKVKTIMALAQAIGKTPGEILDELISQSKDKKDTK